MITFEKDKKLIIESQNTSCIVNKDILTIVTMCIEFKPFDLVIVLKYKFDSLKGRRINQAQPI